MSAPTSGKLWYLSEFALFSELTPEDIDQLAQVTVHKEFGKSEVVYFPGDPANTIYLLIQGQVRIMQISDDGKEAILAMLFPGDFFGELALQDSTDAHDSIAESLDDCIICLISKTDFETFLCQRPALSLRITKLMGLRLRRIENQVYNLIFKDTFARLESLLSRFAQEYGIPHPEGRLIDLKLTHQDLGNLINATRPTVSEYLGKLKKRGAIQIQGHKIIWTGKSSSIK